MYVNSTCVAFVHFTNPFNYFCLFTFFDLSKCGSDIVFVVVFVVLVIAVVIVIVVLDVFWHDELVNASNYNLYTLNLTFTRRVW